jgi:hypothetical protein
MRKLSLTLLSLLGISALSIGGLKAVGGTTPIWPAVENQLAKDHVQAGTALEKLIRANQDFSLLRPEEASDKLLIPLWLRVEWRKNHPEGNFAGDDPTGGYPFVLREVAEWMVTHQNLQAPPEAFEIPGGKTATAGANLRISGAQTTARSPDPRRLERHQLDRHPGHLLLLERRRDLGPDGAQPVHRRLLPLRPHRRLDLGRQRLVDDHRHQ